MMTKAKKKRMMKYKQKQLNQMFAYLFVANLIIVVAIMLFALVRTSENNQIEGENCSSVHESMNDHYTVISPANVLQSK